MKLQGLRYAAAALAAMWAVSVSVSVSVSASASAQDGIDALLACMQANVPKQLRVQKVELVATDAKGTVRTLQGRVYAIREPTDSGEHLVRASLRIESPEYLAGASYLVRQAEGERVDGMYVYLPSVRRVRRVSGEFADGALLGTNFSYYDFKQMQYAVSDATPTLDGEAELSGRKAAILNYVPSPESGSQYTRVRSWVDRASCVPLQIEFEVADGVRKRLKVAPAALRQTDDYWYPSEVELTDLKDGGTSVLRVLGLDSDKTPPKRLFDPATFYLGG